MCQPICQIRQWNNAIKLPTSGLRQSTILSGRCENNIVYLYENVNRLKKNYIRNDMELLCNLHMSFAFKVFFQLQAFIRTAFTLMFTWPFLYSVL